MINTHVLSMVYQRMVTSPRLMIAIHIASLHPFTKWDEAPHLSRHAHHVCKGEGLDGCLKAGRSKDLGQWIA